MVRSISEYSAGARWVGRNLTHSCVVGIVLSMAGGALMAQSHDAQIAQKESAKRAENVVLAQELLLAGDDFYRQQKYQEAVSNYSQAYSLLPRGAVSNEIKKASAERYAQAAIEQSKSLSRFGQYDEARDLLKSVLAEAMPDHKGVKQRLAQLDDPIRTNPVLTLEHSKDAEAAGKWLRKAEGYYNLGKFDDALAAYEEVLHLDPYNKAARRGMERLNAAKTDYYRTAYDQTRSEALMQVDSQWELKVNSSLETLQQSSEAERAEMRIQEVYANKIKQIVVPIVDLQDVGIEEAYDLVRVWAREYDQSTVDSNEKGANFVLNIGDKDSDWGKMIRSKRINLNLRSVPLDKVLDFISNATGTQWRFSDHAVIVTPSGAADGSIHRRTFRVPPTFMQDAASKSGASDDPFADEPSDSGALTARVTAKEFLTSLGVSFPDGASAKYIRGSGILMVSNTLQNLDIIEQYVRTYSQSENVQVVLKVTVMDVLRSDVEELGFDWLLGSSSGQTVVSGGTQGNGYPIAQDGLAFPSNSGPVTSGLRSGDTMFEKSFLDRAILRDETFTGPPERAPGVLRLASDDVAVILRGLSQKKSLDRMDTPTIIARSGEKATLFSGREFIYPTEYEPPEIPNTVVTDLNGNFPVTSATATAFETRLVGLSLEAECTVSEDKNYVDVKLFSEIVDFDGFVNYGSPISAPQTVPSTGEVVNVDLNQNAILMPVFRPIRLNTAVTVQDGSSFVIAGLNQSSIETVEDKVPILGDIPLAGRFFKSEGIQKSDRALFIFVNVELKDPTGKNWRDR
ncbi:Amuc_1098 family type IV pilus outer membrane protein [Rubritalea tangerina]|uniref:Amuc_1098 family type IV pilus outer membrane protein n=2 Tax=Rubritalea tangerina TaxID=430798 RepID=A0ABW4ZA23_9BACT